MGKEKPKVVKKECKTHKFVKVVTSDKDHNLLSDLKPSVRKLYNNRLQAYSNSLVEKIRRGTRI